MNPFQFAKTYCSNFNPDSSCKGLGIKDDGSLFSFGPKPKCLLDTPIQRCAFFEQCVMPLAHSFRPPYEKQNTALRHQQATHAVRSYRKSCKLPNADERPCPLCGRAMEPRQQFCETCSENRKKEAKRTWARDRRSNVENPAQPNP